MVGGHSKELVATVGKSVVTSERTAHMLRLQCPTVELVAEAEERERNYAITVGRLDT